MTSPTDLVITREARENLQSIYQYTVRTWGEAQADAYESALHNAFSLLRQFPEMGRTVSSAQHVRVHHLTHHTIVYRYDPGAQTVIILRIVNPRRRPGRPA